MSYRLIQQKNMYLGGGGSGKGNSLWNVIKVTYDKTDPPNIAVFTSAIVCPNFGFQKPRPQTGSRRASKTGPRGHNVSLELV